MKILMVSLGCDKNLCDSEAMLGKLHSAGHEITNDEQEAEVVVIMKKLKRLLQLIH